MKTSRPGSSSHDELLARELGKIAKWGAKFGGGGSAAIGASWGAQLSSRYLPTERFQQEVWISLEAADVLSRLAGFLARHGRVVSPEEGVASPLPSVGSVMGSGFWRLNPTCVVAEVVEVLDGRCLVRISGAAKEGLIKQRSAEKAVHRVIAYLQDED